MGSPKSVIRTLELVNQLGLHLRAASLFAAAAARFASRISVRKDDLVINGKSILALLTLAAGPGARLTVSAEGDDATEALNALEQLVAGKFGEE